MMTPELDLSAFDRILYFSDQPRTSNQIHDDRVNWLEKFATTSDQVQYSPEKGEDYDTGFADPQRISLGQQQQHQCQRPSATPSDVGSLALSIPNALKSRLSLPSIEAQAEAYAKQIQAKQFMYLQTHGMGETKDQAVRSEAKPARRRRKGKKRTGSQKVHRCRKRSRAKIAHSFPARLDALRRSMQPGVKLTFMPEKKVIAITSAPPSAQNTYREMVDEFGSEQVKNVIRASVGICVKDLSAKVQLHKDTLPIELQFSTSDLYKGTRAPHYIIHRQVVELGQLRKLLQLSVYDII